MRVTKHGAHAVRLGRREQRLWRLNGSNTGWTAVSGLEDGTGAWRTLWTRLRATLSLAQLTRACGTRVLCPGVSMAVFVSIVRTLLPLPCLTRDMTRWCWSTGAGTRGARVRQQLGPNIIESVAPETTSVVRHYLRPPDTRGTTVTFICLLQILWTRENGTRLLVTR